MLANLVDIFEALNHINLILGHSMSTHTHLEIFLLTISDFAEIWRVCRFEKCLTPSFKFLN